MAEPKVVKFCTRVGYINSNNRMTYHQQKGTWLWSRDCFNNFAVCRDAVRRTGLSATAELLVFICCLICLRQQLSNRDWLQVRGKNIRTALCCIVC